jgi:signal transduction histidine kinase
VAREVAQLLGVDHTHMGRYEDDGTVTAVGGWSPLPLGTRVKVEGRNVTALVAQTGRPARVDRYGDDAGPIAASLAAGVRSSVGVPIMLEGDLWGVLIASTKQEQPLPADTESRIAAFTQLAAMALSNTEAWAEVHSLADEQSALRRVATLVARGASQADVFDAVASEASRLLGSAATALMRYDPDDAATVVATGGGLSSFELRVPAHAQLIAAEVLRTGRAARVERDDVDPADDLARILGLGAGVGAPIVADGRLWGLVMALTQDDQPPPSTESRLAQFAELVATAIGNSESRAELTASRARIVAATDEERRRVVRDLHDGAQQRLVHTIVTLKLASRALQRGEDPSSFVSEALEQAKRANVELRELSHGILPAVLTRGGLPAAVDALASRMPVPVEIAVSPERLPAAVEATAYFVIAEALTNVAKHARAGRATVATEVEDGLLHIDIHDDGIGGARPDGGGLVGLADRVAVLDGRLNVESPLWGGTLVTADIPVSGSPNAGTDPAIATGD